MKTTVEWILKCSFSVSKQSCHGTRSLSVQISDASGQMKVTCVEPSSPFKQAVLSPDECYILDNGVDGNIFVWKGVNSRDGLFVHFCANSIRRRRPGLDVDWGVTVTVLYVCLQTGPNANARERKEAMATGQKFIKDKNYPKHTQVGRAAS